MKNSKKCKRCGELLRTGSLYCSIECHMLDRYPDSDRIHRRALQLRRKGDSYAEIGRVLAREFPSCVSPKTKQPLSVPRIRSIVERARETGGRA